MAVESIMKISFLILLAGLFAISTRGAGHPQGVSFDSSSRNVAQTDLNLTLASLILGSQNVADQIGDRNLTGTPQTGTNAVLDFTKVGNWTITPSAPQARFSFSNVPSSSSVGAQCKITIVGDVGTILTNEVNSIAGHGAWFVLTQTTNHLTAEWSGYALDIWNDDAGAIPWAVTWSSTPVIDFLIADYQTITLGGATTFSSASLGKGRKTVVLVTCDGTQRNTSFPSDWICVGSSKPSNLAASKHALLKLTSFTAADTGVIMEWLAEP